LREVKPRLRPLFSQERVAASAGAFVDRLLGAEWRKTGWMRAEAAGDPAALANVSKYPFRAGRCRDSLMVSVLRRLG